MPYLFVIVAVIIAANFYFFLLRSKKSRNVGKAAREERIATEQKHVRLVRRLDFEQEDAARRVELRNKTLEMYDQVRKQGEISDGED